MSANYQDAISKPGTRHKTYLKALNTGGTTSIAFVGNVLGPGRPASFGNVHLGLGESQALDRKAKVSVLTLLGTVAALAMLFSSKNVKTQSAAAASVVLANQA